VIVEDLILSAFPDVTDSRQKVARVALLRLLHAAENASMQLQDVGEWIADLLDDPLAGLTAGVLADNAAQAAKRLEVLASELRKSAKDLSRLRSFYIVPGRRNADGGDGDLRLENRKSGSEADESPPF
jgi:hypothetical protein